MAGTFQRHSEGRLLLNVVTGGEPHEQRAYGDFLDKEARYTRTAEFLHVVRELWTSREPVTFAGEHIHIEGAQLNNPPDPIPAVFFGGSSAAAGPVAAKYSDVYLTWGEPVSAVAQKLDWVRRQAVDAGRRLQFGLRIHVISRPTAAEAWAEADRLLAAVDPADVERVQASLARSESEGQRRMLELHGGGSDRLLVGPNLWAGVGLVRGGAGTALVGSHAEVAERLAEYAQLGINHFILSGYPHLEEAYWFGEGVLPLLEQLGLWKHPNRGPGRPRRRRSRSPRRTSHGDDPARRGHRGAGRTTNPTPSVAGGCASSSPRACWAPPSSGTTSSSTPPRPAWCSTSCSSPTPVPWSARCWRSRRSPSGFVMRPIGGLVFGHIGDRIGRKRSLALTMLIMGVATALIGVLPTAAQIGVWAPVLLLVLRMLQGFALGGEWGGAVLLAVEHSPGDRRGRYGAIPQIGLALGSGAGHRHIRVPAGRCWAQLAVPVVRLAHRLPAEPGAGGDRHRGAVAGRRDAGVPGVADLEAASTVPIRDIVRGAHAHGATPCSGCCLAGPKARRSTPGVSSRSATPPARWVCTKVSVSRRGDHRRAADGGAAAGVGTT